MAMPANTVEKFHTLVDRSGGSRACWPWKAGRLKPGPHGGGGYGRFKLRGQQWYTHRLAWVLQVGVPVPNGLDVLHACDNPPCCNPRHLFLGTQKDNTQDMITKGRRRPPSTKNRARGDKHWTRMFPERVPRGAAHAKWKGGTRHDRARR
jgi:hypothetical protein